MAVYAVDFPTLAADSVRSPESLFDTFLHRLSEELKDEQLGSYRLALIPLSPLLLGLMGVYGNAEVRRGLVLGTLVHPLRLVHLRRNPEFPKAVFPRGPEATRVSSRIIGDG